jgi:hypothetical protein
MTSEGGSPAPCATECSRGVARGVRGKGGTRLPRIWGFHGCSAGWGWGVPGGGVGWSGGGDRGGDEGGENSPGPPAGPRLRSLPGLSLSVSLPHSNDRDDERTVSERPRGGPPARRRPLCARARGVTDVRADEPDRFSTPPWGKKAPPISGMTEFWTSGHRVWRRDGGGVYPPLLCWSGPVTRGLYRGSGPTGISGRGRPSPHGNHSNPLPPRP